MNLNGPINGAVSSLAGIFCGMTTTPNVRDKLSAQYRRTFLFSLHFERILLHIEIWN